jgi:hypothetical protein
LQGSGDGEVETHRCHRHHQQELRHELALLNCQQIFRQLFDKIDITGNNFFLEVPQIVENDSYVVSPSSFVSFDTVQVESGGGDLKQHEKQLIW